MLIRALLTLSLALSLSGCAYSVGTSARRLPEGHTLVAVPVFKNLTHEVGIEVPFTNAMIRELERAQLAKVVERSEAQVVLEGAIDSVQFAWANQLGGGSAESVIPKGTILNTEYRIILKAHLQLRRLSDSRVLWTEDFTGERSYLAPKIGLEGLNSANALYNHSARYENLSAMATDLMAEAHGRLTENF